MGFEINDLYRFEEFEVDPSNRLFTGLGKAIPVPSRAFDVLLYMVRNPQRLLTREELMKAVWSDAAVEEGNLTQTVFLLRKALSSVTPELKLIVTVPARGYRFEATVEKVAGPVPDLEPLAPVDLPDISPAGGKKIPFRRWVIAGAFALTAVSAALAVLPGLFERRDSRPLPLPLPVTANAAENPILAGSVSPDGKYLAYADPASITIRTLHSGETRSLPVATGTTPIRLVWYPDDSQLLVGQTVNGAPELLSISLLSGKLSPLRGNAFTPAISPQGDRISYTDGTHRELWVMDGNGENPRRILTTVAPDKIYAMFWSPNGARIWFARVHWDKDKSVTTIETCDLKGTDQTVALSDDRVLAFILLPPARLICAIREREQNFTNLWEMPVNAASGKSNGPLRKVTNWTNFNVSYLSATTDGNHLALLNGGWQADVYVGDLRAGGTELANTRRLTLDQSDDWPAFWTPDDKAVVFESNRNGRSQIFRQRLDQTVPDLLSTDAEQDENPTFGGPWIYFHSVPPGARMTWDKPAEIRRVPINGGASAEVLRDTGVDVSCAADRPEICALARLSGRTLSFYRFSATTGQGVEIGSMHFDSHRFPSSAVSPDGSVIAVLDPKGAENRIRLMPMNGDTGSEIEVSGRKGLETLFWAADGKGWFVSSTTPTNGEYLLHVNPAGESQVLYEQPEDGRTTWGIPSHDGKHLAFLRWTAPRNVWMIDGIVAGSPYGQ